MGIMTPCEKQHILFKYNDLQNLSLHNRYYTTNEIDIISQGYPPHRRGYAPFFGLRYLWI